MSSVALLPDNSLHTDDPAMRVIVEGGWRNKLTLPQIEKLGIPIVHTWNHSVPLWEYHHGFQVGLKCSPSPGRHAYSVALNTPSLRKRSCTSMICKGGQAEGCATVAAAASTMKWANRTDAAQLCWQAIISRSTPSQGVLLLQEDG